MPASCPANWAYLQLQLAAASDPSGDICCMLFVWNLYEIDKANSYTLQLSFKEKKHKKIWAQCAKLSGIYIHLVYFGSVVKAFL